MTLLLDICATLALCVAAPLLLALQIRMAWVLWREADDARGEP